MTQSPIPSISHTPGSSIEEMWQDYHARGTHDDETWDINGQIRPCWSRFIETMAGYDGAGLTQMDLMADRQLREHGATFHLHSSGDEKVHPWRLDPIPLLIESQDWATIDQGLRQRARLLSLVLDDLYGPQDLIRRGLIPQDLILRHPGFQRACSGSTCRGPFALFHYAADLARGPGDRMWVVNDRTGIPPGTGYMLENRTIMARLLPEEIRQLQVHRLSGSFRAMRTGLGAIAPDISVRPRVVFYTPGPYSPAYFEHTYLASYLGYTLVQGEDLLVRGGRVWLKALEGLQPVDVIIRRVSDAFCDPLEMKADSQLGVPGLLEAVRRGTVRVANGIGSDVLENSGLMPFLTGLAQELLGEDLILPTAATWWCGQGEEKQYVLDHLEELAIKRIDRVPVAPANGLGPYSAEERAELVRAIEAEPWRYLGQERVHFSTMPVLENGRFEPRAMTLRAFTMFDGADYHTFPGGLTRCGDPGQAYIPSSQLGGICKDTWVLAPEPVTYNSLWMDHLEDDDSDSLAGFFTSNAVENLFWTGRYMERAGCMLQTIRVLLQTYEQSMASGADAYDRCLHHLWRGFVLQAGMPEGIEQTLNTGHPPPLPTITPFITDGDTPGGLPMVLHGFANAAYAVRENWSTDTWSMVNRVQELTGDMTSTQNLFLHDIQDKLDALVQLLQAFAGQCAESMTRTAGWLFLEIGRRLEHSLMMLDLLEGALDTRGDEMTEYYLLEALLTANESLVTYRRAYRTSPTLENVLDLLLLQSKNPKSLCFQMQEMKDGLASLHEEIHLETVGHLVGDLTDALDLLKAQQPGTLADANPDGQFPDLKQVLHELKYEKMLKTGETLNHACFKHAPMRPLTLQFSPQPWQGNLPT